MIRIIHGIAVCGVILGETLPLLISAPCFHQLFSVCLLLSIRSLYVQSFSLHFAFRLDLYIFRAFLCTLLIFFSDSILFCSIRLEESCFFGVNKVDESLTLWSMLWIYSSLCGMVNFILYFFILFSPVVIYMIILSFALSTIPH